MRKGCKHMILGIFTLAFLAQSCSTVKHLPEDEVLYLGTRSLKYHNTEEGKGVDKVKKKAEKSVPVIRTLWVKPNGGLFGMPFIRFIPFRLHFYNWFYTEQDSTFSSWMMDNFGEPPLTISEVNPEVRVGYIENYLFNRGYFGVEGEFELKYKNSSKGNKAWLLYSFVLPDAYTYRKVGFQLDSAQEVFRGPIESYMKESLITPGNRFNLEEIAREKQLLWEHLQNDGYYYLGKNQILIIADTTAGQRQVDLEYRIHLDDPGISHEKVFIGDRSIMIDGTMEGSNDSGIVITGKGVKIREKLLDKAISIHTDSVYTLENSKKTIRNLTSLGIFSEPTVTYHISPMDSTRLETHLNMNTVDMFNLGINTDMTIKNIGYLGPTMGIFATQKNLFGGGENLTFSIDGYLDFPTGVMSERSGRSSGFTIGTSFSSPVLRSPLPFGKNAPVLPRRAISLSFELNSRADLYKIAEWKTAYSFSWIKNRKITHQINLINLTYAHLLNSTADFDTLIQQSDLVSKSYRDQFILGPSYSFTYNNTLDKSRRFRTYYRAEIETSGNLIHGINRLSGNSESEQELMGVPYSQYVRLFSDFRAYYQVGKRGSQLAFRNVLGWGAAYGNSNSMPYTRQFFIGGSNSIRPVTSRVVGPGSYLEFDEGAFNQVGDIKLENNLEYRFKIWYVFYGALWSDLGNIWLLKEDPERPGSGIRLGSILKESYFTSGVGLRVDLNFLVLRADYGAVLYLPVFSQGFNWIWQNKLPLYGLVFGIGYPF